MKILYLQTITAALFATFSILNHYKNESTEKLQQITQESSKDSIPTPIYDLYTHWKSKYNKNYLSDSENNHRAQIFYENYKYINANQPTDNTYTLGLNKFADLTKEEFKNMYLGNKKDAKRMFKSSNKNYKSKNTADLPKTTDWNASGAVTPIKNQGQCGSCWSFATSGALEGLNFIKNGTLKTFSEQQQMDCSKEKDGNQSCEGGYMDKAYDYVQSKGIMLESDYQYQAMDRTVCDYKADEVAFNIDSHGDVPVDDNDQLKAAISHQPVSVGISGEQIQFYVSGVWSYWLCFTEVDHGVLATGYGADEGNNMFWNVKNSWGEDWGENGYIRFARRDGQSPGMCGITKMASYPIKN